MKKVIIIGATSGIGKGLAFKYLESGNIVAVTGRREANLLQIRDEFLSSSNNVSNGSELYWRAFDITADDAMEHLSALITQMGGVDLCIYCAGFGKRNLNLNPEIEMKAVEVNVKAYTRTVLYITDYFRENSTPRRRGQFVVISSIAGARPLGVSPGYSATKSYQIDYQRCLEKTNRIVMKRELRPRYTTIQPGFVDTDFISGSRYPLKMSLEKAVKRIYSAIERNKRRAVIGKRWRIILFFWSLIPNNLWVRMKL